MPAEAVFHMSLCMSCFPGRGARRNRCHKYWSLFLVNHSANDEHCAMDHEKVKKKNILLGQGLMRQPKERIYPKIRPLSWIIIRLYRFKHASLDACVCMCSIAIQYLSLMEGFGTYLDAIWGCGKIQGCVKWRWNTSNTISKSITGPTHLKFSLVNECTL